MTTDRVESDLETLKSDLLASRYLWNVRAWFGEWLRPVDRVTVDDLELFDRARDAGELTYDQEADLRRADLLVKGRARPGTPLPDGDVVLVLEASATIDGGDVERAARRAAILGRAGYTAVPVCGGFTLTQAAATAAESLRVLVDLREP
ncbi:MAG: hypothetical protein ACKVVT_19035 [Dehalococcoidia bacterium]